MGDVMVTLIERPAPLPRGTEALLQPQWRDRVLAFWPQPHEVAEVVEIARLAERRKRHHLVLIGGVQEAKVLRHALVEQAEGMRQMDLAEPLQPVAGTAGVTGRGLLAAAVERQYRGPREG